LHQLRESLKAEYTKMEKGLKNEARMRLVAAVLSGAAGLPNDVDALDDEDLAKRAIAIADATIRQITITETL
jgi:hypothetical protein